MLVCNVSLRPPGRAIAADVAEAVAASDATATGNIVFATLVDDPASVGDMLDAYLGEIMIEMASAAAVVDGGFASVNTLNEAATASDTQDANATTSTARSAMLPDVFVNSDGTGRAAHVHGIMINL